MAAFRRRLVTAEEVDAVVESMRQTSAAVRAETAQREATADQLDLLAGRLEHLAARLKAGDTLGGTE